uniref:DUF5598 domain-containing protein n=1 Tax=Steinernema glaseri TaxID=37863 RepID=A0A1I7Z7Y4_9BILA
MVAVVSRLVLLSDLWRPIYRRGIASHCAQRSFVGAAWTRVMSSEPVTLFEGPATGKYMFNVGAPPVWALKKAGVLYDGASRKRMAEEINDSARLLQYGTTVGDPRLIRAIKKFLEEQYRDSVDEKALISTGRL